LIDWLVSVRRYLPGVQTALGDMARLGTVPTPRTVAAVVRVCAASGAFDLARRLGYTACTSAGSVGDGAGLGSLLQAVLFAVGAAADASK
jgi:hypothetical protein